MHMVVEVGDWEHECCGPTYQRDDIVELTCLVVTGQGDHAIRYVETHHDVSEADNTVDVRGRVADLCVLHLDGSTEQIVRLPSGDALRGFDEDDDGHLEQPGTGALVMNDSNRYLLTIAT